MTNSLLNPKALLFFMVFLPQFVDVGKGPVSQQLIVLGGVLTVISIVFHAVLGVAGGTVNRLMAGNKTASRWQSRGLAFVLVLLAIRLAFTSRPQ